MNARAHTLRRILSIRSAGYNIALAMSLVGTIVLSDTVARLSAAFFVVTAAAWSVDYRRQTSRSAALVRQSLRELQRDVARIEHNVRTSSQRTAEQTSTLEGLKGVAEQARAASESAIALMTEVRLVQRGPEDRPRILFVTSNGSGMGHLTRLLAIARAGMDQFDASFVSLSTAASIVTEFGYPCTRVASQSHTRLSWAEWNRRFGLFMRSHIRSTRPDVIVFDGIHVYRGLHEAASAFDVPLAWVCRGLWKDHVSRTQLDGWRDIAQRVIVPTERPILTDDRVIPIADEDLLAVDPIVLVRPEEKRSRSGAIDQLGLEPGQRHVLIQLGSGALSDRSEHETTAVRAVRGLGPDWTPVIFRSPLSDDGEEVPGARVVRNYPMAANLAAFEFSITSAGYNTVHENLRFRQVAIYVPDASMLADDQVARAEAVRSRGAGLVANTSTSIADAVATLGTENAKRLEIERRLDGNIAANTDGAAEAARAIYELARQGPVPAGLPYELHESEQGARK